MIDGKNFFDQPIKIYKKTCKNIWKITTGQGDDYSTGCLLDHNYSKKHYKTIAIDLSKQQVFDGGGANNRIMFFIIKETKTLNKQL